MGRVLQEVTHSADISNPERVYDAFSKALEKSKDFFWRDRSRFFHQNDCFFKSRIKNRDGDAEEALLIPPSRASGNMAAILPPKVYFQTHSVRHPSGNEYDARMMIKIDGNVVVDPFDFRLRNGHKEARDDSGSWRSVDRSEIVFKVNVGDEEKVVAERDIQESKPVIILEEWQIEKPMVFIYLPTDNQQTYYQVKMMADFEFGVASQCAVDKKFTSQRNPDQYCSNIALKCNSKLMNKWNNARAWNTLTNQSAGIPWIRDEPTMVIGIDASHGLGQDSISIIVGSVGLDSGCMQLSQCLRIQSKSNLISTPVMKSITKCLYYHFVQHNNIKPNRLLVYRDGVSEGEFDRVMQYEVSAIRQALYNINVDEARARNEPYECENKSNCKARGCIFCTMPITFVVSQSQHSIRIVPGQEPYGRDKNVPSGTCVDHTIMDMRENNVNKDVPREKPPGAKIDLYEDASSTGFDFLLTSQGGLKGTSKPVYYRVLLNENAIWKSSQGSDKPLGKELLQHVTYYQSYQYGTATKAVRGIPLIYYSRRLAHRAMGYVNYLRAGKRSSYWQDEPIQTYDLADGEDEPIIGRDGAPSVRKVYIRRNMERIESLELKFELLPDFSPYLFSEEGGDLKFCPPFRPHLSA